MLTYEQLTGRLRDDAGELLGGGYSGKGAGKNNPAMENVMDVGPCPSGRYKIVGPPISTPDHGPFVLRLIPNEETKARIIALGRDPLSFLMHGDSIPHPGNASEGCIIQSHDVRVQVWAMNPRDPDLEVVSGINHSDVDGEISV